LSESFSFLPFADFIFAMIPSEDALFYPELSCNTILVKKMHFLRKSK
jgi:hypothetical protein